MGGVLGKAWSTAQAGQSGLVRDFPTTSDVQFRTSELFPPRVFHLIFELQLTTGNWKHRKATRWIREDVGKGNYVFTWSSVGPPSQDRELWERWYSTLRLMIHLQHEGKWLVRGGYLVNMHFLNKWYFWTNIYVHWSFWKPMWYNYLVGIWSLWDLWGIFLLYASLFLLNFNSEHSKERKWMCEHCLK